MSALSPFPTKALRQLREPTAPGGIRVVTEVFDHHGRWVDVLRFLFVIREAAALLRMHLGHQEQIELTAAADVAAQGGKP